VPLLKVADDRHLAESNAILWYIAGHTIGAGRSRRPRENAAMDVFGSTP